MASAMCMHACVRANLNNLHNSDLKFQIMILKFETDLSWRELERVVKAVSSGVCACLCLCHFLCPLWQRIIEEIFRSHARFVHT